VEFNIKVLTDGLVKFDHLKILLEYAQDNGLGADRSQQYGQFDLLELVWTENKRERREPVFKGPPQ